MARYPTTWLEPVTDAKAIEVPLEKGDPRLNETIKPARNHMTYAENYDPLIE